MPLGLVKDSATGWRYEGEMDDVLGYVIRDLRHDQHPFARLIAVALVMVESHNGSSETFWLGPDSPRAEIVDGPLTRSYTKGRKQSPRGHYSVRFKTSTTYRVQPLLQEKNQKLFIEQTTLFTQYTKDPAHEPGGILKAARVYPLVRVSSPATTGSSSLTDPGNRIAAVRVLQILGFALAGPFARNQVGVWKDLEIPGTGGTGPGAVAFRAAEKPLVLEMVGDGLEGNSNLIMMVTDADWDNIHQWVGAFANIAEWKKSFTQRVLPPSPGMPYAAHQHWRWGAIATYNLPLVGSGGGPQFRGVQGTRGGALVDGKLPNQSLSFAIAKPANIAVPVFQAVKLGEFGFNDPLDKIIGRFPPETLWQGERELVQWIDVTARSNHSDEGAPYPKAVSTDFSGTLFTHGIFFAHEGADVIPFTVGLAVPGAHLAQYIPKLPERRWKRP